MPHSSLVRVQHRCGAEAVGPIYGPSWMVKHTNFWPTDGKSWIWMDKIYSCWLYIPLNAAMKLDLATGQLFGVMMDSEQYGEIL